MPRHLRPTFAAVSLACCMLLCALWVTSWSWAPTLLYADPGGFGTANVRCYDGVLAGFYWQSTHSPTPQLTAGVDEYPNGRAGTTRARIRTSVTGFSFTIPIVGAGRAWIFAIPLWFPILLTLIAPTRRWRQRRTAAARGFEVKVPAA